MIDLKKLEAEREKASEDKADLFDFYHKNWDALVKAAEASTRTSARAPAGGMIRP